MRVVELRSKVVPTFVATIPLKDLTPAQMQELTKRFDIVAYKEVSKSE